MPDPISTAGAILARFAATPVLVAAVPGGLGPPISGAPALPYAELTEVGGTADLFAGAPGVRLERDRYMVAIVAAKESDCRRIADLLIAAFNPAATAAMPLPRQNGSVIMAAVTDYRMDPGVQTDRANREVYRLVLRLETLTQRTSV